MRIKLIAVAALIGLTAVLSAAQSAVITPRKTVYRRSKPLSEFKRTFTIRRPIAKVASPTVSARITRAINPEQVLDINLREEVTEYQWLEEADYKVLFNARGVLSVELWMTGTGAYPDGVTKHVVVNLGSGVAIRVGDVLTNLPTLAKRVRARQKKEVEDAIREMKSEPDARPEELFSETNFTAKDFGDFSVDGKGVTFYYDYGFPHAVEAFQPAGEFHFGWAELKPFVKPDGLLARFVR